MSMNRGDRTDGKFTVTDFLVRLAAALLLVLLTFNPTRFCYVSWLQSAIAAGEAGALHALAGIVLVIGWTIFARTTWASLGSLGLLLGGVFLGAIVWVLVDFGLLSISSGTTFAWIVLVCISALLAAGMSWGHWKRRASGQVEVDEIEH